MLGNTLKIMDYGLLRYLFLVYETTSIIKYQPCAKLLYTNV